MRVVFPFVEKGGQKKPAFTLMEIVVVLFILVTIMGAATMYLFKADDETYLKEVSGELEAYAREAQNLAIMQNETYRLVLTENTLELFKSQANTASSPSLGVFVPEKETPLKSYRFPDDKLRWSIKRWGGSALLFPTQKAPFVWVFAPEGFVEPIQVEVSRDKAYLRQDYHPLTASVVEEELYIP